MRHFATIFLIASVVSSPALAEDPPIIEAPAPTSPSPDGEVIGALPESTPPEPEPTGPRILLSSRLGIAVVDGDIDYDDAAFGMDLTAGVRLFSRGTGLFIGFDGGFTINGAGSAAETRALMIGAPLGVVVLNRLGGFGYRPDLIVGRVGGEGAIGVRNTGFLCVGACLLTLDLAHQVMFAGGERNAQVRITLGLDVGMLLFILHEP